MLLEPAFSSFAEFLQMGKHGPYVWSIYAIGLVIYLGNFVAAKLSEKRTYKMIARNLRRENLQVSSGAQITGDSSHRAHEENFNEPS